MQLYEVLLSTLNDLCRSPSRFRKRDHSNLNTCAHFVSSYNYYYYSHRTCRNTQAHTHTHKKKKAISMKHESKSGITPSEVVHRK